MAALRAAFFLLFLAGCSNAQTTASHVMVPGNTDNQGACYCYVTQPDNPFPVQQLVDLENTVQTLTTRFEQEQAKILEYSSSIDVCEQKIKELSVTLGHMDKSSVPYSELDFDLVKLEIVEMEQLVKQLKESVDGGNQFVDQLYEEIKNITVTVQSLEQYDKNNLLAIRKDVVALKKRLTECERSTDGSRTSFTVQGSCDHGGILNISKPHIVQQNWRGQSYFYGGWGRGYSLQDPTMDVYWITPLNTDGRYMQSYRIYNSYDDLLLYKNYKDHSIYYGQGSGSVVYDGHLYYNHYSSGDICKVNILNNTQVLRKGLPDADYNNRFPYAGVSWQDFDFAVDESGLWVIYTTVASEGDIVISKLNETTLDVEKTWQTKVSKPTVSNAFIVCGVLYVVRSAGKDQEELFYSFDTKTGQEGKPSIMISKMSTIIQSINYSPMDQKLYVYSNGYQITHDITYKHVLG